MIIFRILLQFYADFLQTVHRFISLIAKRMLNHSIMTQYVSCAFAKHGRIALYITFTYIYTYVYIKRTIRQTRRSHFDCCTLYDRTDRLHLIYQPYTTHPKCSCVFVFLFFFYFLVPFNIYFLFILLLAAVLVAGTVLGGALADAERGPKSRGSGSQQPAASSQQPAAEK